MSRGLRPGGLPILAVRYWCIQRHWYMSMIRVCGISTSGGWPIVEKGLPACSTRASSTRIDPILSASSQRRAKAGQRRRCE
jgi:hypothetical protein